MNEQAVWSVLATIKDPLMQETYVDLKAVDTLTIGDDRIHLTLKFGVHAASLQHKTILTLKSQLEAAGASAVDISVCTEVLASPKPNTQTHLAGVKNIVMVASGKGGVGKSTTAVNLALALHAEGANVGLLDADIYGPSQRAMLGVSNGVKPKLVNEKFLLPVECFGIKSMSVGYMSEEKTPMLWRGSMAVRALQQLVEQTVWGELDYLVVDMPPGTGDIQISLAQIFQVAGAVIVTTPQEIALIDARKGIEMFQKVDIPVLGITENMSTHICSNCGYEEAIFGSGGAKKLAQEYKVPLLGALPLDTQIREHVDSGLPTVVSDPLGSLAGAYTSLAHQVAAQLWRKNISSIVAPLVVITID